ncbi:MAG: response regulator transcription factor [Chloroflexi bacterium]|nr:response regulator transcription factor [Chloroflexota bacterium]
MTNQRNLNEPVAPTLSPRILIVDDEAQIRTSLARALQLSGYRVAVAEDGAEALVKLAEEACDLMLLDLRMPEVDGLAVMRRAHVICPELPIIVLTGHADLASAVVAVQTEAADYLRKPASLDDILSAVGRALQAREARAQRLSVLETLARTAEVLRGAPAAQSEPLQMESLLQAGPVALHVAWQRVYLTDGDNVRSVELTDTETAILAFLLARPGQVVSCRRLALHVFDQEMDQYAAENLIRPLIFRLRRKIEATPQQPRLIRTARGVGYFFAG